MKKNSLVWCAVWCICITVLLVRLVVDSIDTLHDEAFFVELAVRYVQGDAMITEDWFPSFVAFLYYPFIYLWMKITGGLTGIFLFNRLTWFLIKTMIAYYFWHIYYRKSDIWGMYGTMLFWFADSFNMSIICYNTIVVLSCFVTLSFLHLKLSEWWHMMLLGFVWAIAVVANPWCIIVPLVYLVAFLFEKIRSHNISMALLGYPVLGAMLVAVLLGVFILSKDSLVRIVLAFPQLLINPEHDIRSSYLMIHILNPLYHMMVDYPLVSIGYGFLTILVSFCKKRISIVIPFVYGIICCAYIIINKYFFAMNEIYIVFTYLAIVEFVMLLKYKVSSVKLREYAEMIGYVILFSLATALGTDVGAVTILGTLSMLGVVDLFLACELLENQEINISIANNLIHLSTIIMIFCVFALRVVITWGDVLEVADYKHVVEEGPLAGTSMDEELYQEYKNIYETVSGLDLTYDDRILALSSTQIAYMCTDGLCGAPMLTIGELADIDLYEEMLTDYYEFNPHMIPKAIYSQEPIAKFAGSNVFNKICDEYDIIEDEVGFVAIRK